MIIIILILDNISHLHLSQRIDWSCGFFHLCETNRINMKALLRQLFIEQKYEQCLELISESDDKDDYCSYIQGNSSVIMLMTA